PGPSHTNIELPPSQSVRFLSGSQNDSRIHTANIGARHLENASRITGEERPDKPNARPLRSRDRHPIRSHERDSARRISTPEKRTTSSRRLPLPPKSREECPGW